MIGKIQYVVLGLLVVVLLASSYNWYQQQRYIKAVNEYMAATKTARTSAYDFGLKMLELGYVCRQAGDTVEKCKRDITIVLDGIRL